MHKLNRPQTPSCLSKYQHGRDNWEKTSEDRAEIWQHLTQMQGNLCAYCERELKQDHKHIEHFRQKASHIYPQGTFQWDNLFGSCDTQNSCGKYKDNNAIPYKHTDLIKPDIEDPEDYFHFENDGTITIDPNLSSIKHHRAKETLRIFNLESLRQVRESATIGYRQTAEFLIEVLSELGEEEYKLTLQKELDKTKNLPFSTAIKHTLML